MKVSKPGLCSSCVYLTHVLTLQYIIYDQNYVPFMLYNVHCTELNFALFLQILFQITENFVL